MVIIFNAQLGQEGKIIVSELDRAEVLSILFNSVQTLML